MAADVATLRQLLLESKQDHYHCEDSWYCCRKCEHPDHGPFSLKGVCDCGADHWNNKVDAALKEDPS